MTLKFPFQVARDIALIKSPAAGLRRAAKEMETDDLEGNDDEEDNVAMEDEGELDTSVRLASKAKKKSSKKSRVRIVEEIHEGEEEDAVMVEN